MDSGTPSASAAPKLFTAYQFPTGGRLWTLKDGSQFQQIYTETSGKAEYYTLKGKHKPIVGYPEIDFSTASVKSPKRVEPLHVAGIARCFGTIPKMGSDPEFFIAKADTKDKVPAFEVLPKAGSWFWDGFQAETTVKPANCHVYLATHLRDQFRDLRLRGFDAQLASVWRVPELPLMTAAEEHVTFGCAPSQNVYDFHAQEVGDPRQLKYRFAGGHLHFEFPDDVRNDASLIKEMVKALDAIVAVPLVAILDGYDKQIRRKHYGLAGEFRIPAHGLEYRTLSNGPMQHPQLFQLVVDLARFAVNVARMGLRRQFAGNEALVRETINYNDVRAAKLLYKANRPLYDHFGIKHYSLNHKKQIDTIVEGGAQAVLKDWEDGPMLNWLGKEFLANPLEAERQVRFWMHV